MTFIYLSGSDKNVQDFIIPELPSGESLTIDILSTWGDKNYVGLNGIEIFSSTGQTPIITKVVFIINLDIYFCWEILKDKIYNFIILKFRDF